MSSNELKNEFKDFVKELTTEICVDVCLDKILQINKEYEKNNTQLQGTVDNMGKLIEASKEDLNQIAVNNSNQFLKITDTINKSIKKRENEFNEILEKNKKKYEEIFWKFLGVINDAKKSTQKLDENNENLKNILKEVKLSNTTAQSALSIVNNQDKTFFSDMEKRNDKIFSKYRNDILSFNEQQRQLFINKMSEAIRDQKDYLSSEIIEDVNQFTNKITDEVMNESRACFNKIDKFMENDKSQLYYDDILNSINIINKKIDNVENEINKNENELSEIIKAASDRYNNDFEEVKSNYNLLQIIVKEARDDINKINYTMNEINSSYEKLAKRMNIWVSVFKYFTIVICILITGVVCYEMFIRELIS